MRKAAELLAPAGNMESLRAAIRAGADAVYVGGERFGARAYAENFDTQALCGAIDYVHLFGRRIYLTLNTLLKEDELWEIPAYVLPFYEAGLDGVIVQDLGAADLIRSCFPEMELHASTQMTVTGVEGARLLRGQGFCRIVPARELSLEELRWIKEETGIEVETFIHGAMCYSYSGQCLFSSFLGGRSGNRGRCAGPCRLPYDIIDDAGRRVNTKCERYPLSLKDMGVLPILPKLLDSGIDSFKIEGRMKSPAYVAGVTSIYRKYIDLYMQDREHFAVRKEDLRNLQSLYTRGGMETGYYERHHGREMVTLSAGGYEKEASDFSRGIEERYVDVQDRITLRGRAVLRIGEPVRLTLTAAAGQIEVCSPGAVLEAQNRPMEEADIRRQLLKTGNTLFVLEDLTIYKDENIFVPIKELNEVRRRGLEALTQQLLAPYRHRMEPKKGTTQQIAGQTNGAAAEQAPRQTERPAHFAIAVTSYEQYQTVIRLASKQPVCRLYVPYRIYGSLSAQDREKLLDLREQGVECYLSFPAVVRERELAAIRRFLEAGRADGLLGMVDGFLVNNLELLAFFRELSQGREDEELAGKKLQADHGLYSFNTAAFGHLKRLGADGVTAPLEWSRHELAAFRERLPQERLELVVYGYLPLMQSANCIRSTMNKCSHGGGDAHWYLEDRYQKRFPILADCGCCTNTILNSVPLSLHREWDALRNDKNLLFRLYFTVEDGSQTRERAQQFFLLSENGRMSEPPETFTTGHFRKGVW